MERVDLVAGPNLIRFIQEPVAEELHLLLRGHLYVEGLLELLLEKSVQHPTALPLGRMGFHQKVKLLYALGLFAPEMQELLLEINSIRNRHAHDLRFTLDFDTAYVLVTKAVAANIEFTDDIITDKATCRKYLEVAQIVVQVLSNTFQALIWNHEDKFTKEEVSEFLG